MATTTLDATITRTNARGFCVAERDGWLNVSKYADPADVTLPPIGSRILLTLDGQGYVRRIAPAEGASDPAVNPWLTAPTSAPSGRPGRDRTITRLAVLNTAVSALASGGRAVDPAALLDLAAQLEAWASR